MVESLQKQIEEKGYHIFSISKNKIHNHYPGAFNDYPGVSLSSLNLNDMITTKVFYIEKSELVDDRIIDIYLDLVVNEIFSDNVKATISTPLPPNFPLNRGDVLEVQEDEILYSVNLKKGVLRRKSDQTNVH